MGSARLVQLVMPQHAEDLLQAAISTGRINLNLADYLSQMTVLSSVPVPESTAVEHLARADDDAEDVRDACPNGGGCDAPHQAWQDCP